MAIGEDLIAKCFTVQGDIESTGVLDGCVVSPNAGDASLFDITSGTVQFVDSFTDPLKPTFIQKKFIGGTGITVTNLATANATNISILNSANNPLTTADLVQQVAPLDHTEIRTKAWCASLGHPNRVTITREACEQTFPRDAINHVRDISIALGMINESGNAIQENGANLNLDRSNGLMYAFGAVACDDKSNPSGVTTIQESAFTFFPAFQDGAGGTSTDPPTTFVDPEFIDDGSGTLAAMQNNKFQIKRIFIIPRASLAPDSGSHVIFYGQVTHNSFADAVQALNTEKFVIEVDLLREFHLLAFLIIQQGETDIAAAIAGGSAAIFPADKFGQRSSGGGGGTTNLQQAYNNSINPEIVTDATRNGLTLRVGSGLDTDSVLNFENTAGTQTGRINGNGSGSFDRGLIINEGGNDSDTRIEGDTDPNLFFTDASTNRIGIGTNAPESKLHLEEATGGVNFQIESGDAGVGHLFFIGNGTPDESVVQLLVSGSVFRYRGLNDALTAETFPFLSFDLSNGNAGIGVITPNARLDVRGDAIFNEDGGDFDFRVEGDTDPDLFLVDAGDDTIRIGGNITQGSGVKFAVRDVATISQFGFANGTLSSVGFAEVVRNNFFLTATDGATRGAAVLIAGAEQQWTSDAATRDGFFAINTRINDSSVEKVRVTSAGRVGIGTTIPGALLDVRGTAIFNEDGGDFDFRVEGDTEPNLLFVDASTERIGIGTATPSEKIHAFDSVNSVRLLVETGGANATMRFIASGGRDWVMGLTSMSDVFQITSVGSGGTELSVDGAGNIFIGDLSAPTAAASAASTIHLLNDVAPTGSITNGILLYSEDVSSSAELKVRDEAGNVTTLSPHNFDLMKPSEDMAWAYHSEKEGRTINVDMLKLARAVEKISGEKLVYQT